MSAARVSPAPAAPRETDATHFDPQVPDIDYGVLDQLVGYNVRRAQLVIYEDFVQTLAPWGITPQRFSALTLIARNESLKLTELARVLGIARSGAVQIVDALAQLGYVERHPAADDRRAYGLALTARGHHQLVEITRAVVAHDKRIADRLRTDDPRQLMHMLRQIAGQGAKAFG